MMDRTAATRWTRLAQAGAIGAVALSAAAVMVSMPGQDVEEPPAQVALPEPPRDENAGAAEVMPRADVAGTGARLALIINNPEPKPPPDDETLPPPPPPATDITYHGMVSMGSRSMALLKHNGKQRFVKVSDKVGDEAVEEILPEQVRLGAAHIIPLAERSGGAVSRLQAVSNQSVTAAFNESIEMLGKRAQMDEVAMAIAAKQGHPPPFVAPEDVPMWRKMRAQLILSGEYEMNAQLDEMAYKLMGERRAELKENPLLTPDEEDAERALMDKREGGQAGGKR